MNLKEQITKQLQLLTTEKNMSSNDAWNYCLIDMSRFSKSYSQYLLLMNFINGINEEYNTGNSIGINERNVLYDLIQLERKFSNTSASNKTSVLRYTHPCF